MILNLHSSQCRALDLAPLDTYEHALQPSVAPCFATSLQVLRRVPEGFGFEAWKQLCKEFEPRLPSRFQAMLQAISSPTTTDDPVQTIYQWESRVKVYEEQSGENVAENIKLAVLQKYLWDGELARHLNLQSGRLTTYD